MKQYFCIILSVFAFASCAKEIEISLIESDAVHSGQPSLVPLTFQAKAELMGTKSDISFPSILWEADDELAVFDGSAFNKFSVVNLSDDGRTATFSGSAADAASYYAIAPYSAATNISTENTRLSVKIPSTQTIIGSHCVDTGSLVSTAVDDGNGGLVFTNQFSLMKVKLDRNDVVSVMLRGNDSENVGGTNHFYYGGEGAPRMDFSNAAGKSVRIVYKASADSEASAFPAGEYYIVLWPTTFSEGYTVVITTEEGAKGAKKKTSQQVLVRNSGQDVSTVDNVNYCPAEIVTAAQLKTWRNLAEIGVYGEGDEVRLGADIDLGGYDWKPVTNYLGIFDGQGHKIYNFKVGYASDNRMGFLRTLGSSSGEFAVLKNVIFGSSDGSSWDGSSQIELLNSSADSWSYAGLVGYAHKNSVIENVVNFVPVTASAAVTTRHAVGGISGAAGDYATIKDCVNYATITSKAACETTEDSAVGGILGATGSKDVSVISCTNEGSIDNTCVGVSTIGGVVGKSTGTGLLVDGCVNAGSVSNSAASMGSTKGNWDIYVAGVLGFMGNTTVVNECTNTGKLYQAAATNSAYDVCFGGIVGGSTKNGCIIKGCTNSAEFCYEMTEFSSWLAAGGILGYTRGSVTITKSDNGSPTVNTGQYFQRRNHTKNMYVGGIAGLIEKQTGSIIEYCTNEGRIVGFGDQSTAKVEFYGGGICGGASSGVLSNCVNNGFLIARSGNHIAYFGGIAGSKNKYPTSILGCINNGTVSGYNSSGSTRLGGILAVFQADKTEVRNCLSNCLITTGNVYTNSSGNTAGEPINFQSKDYYKGGLFGEVLAPGADVTDNVTGCIVNCTLSNQSPSKEGWTGIVAGQTKSTSSTSYKLAFGTASDPILIVNTSKIEYGSNSNPATITPGDVINTTANAYKWLMGTESKLYNASTGSSNTDKVDFNFTIVSPTQAGIE